MSKLNIVINVDSVNVEYGASRQVEVTLENLDVEEVIDEIGVDEILNAIDESELHDFVDALAL